MKLNNFIIPWLTVSPTLHVTLNTVYRYMYKYIYRERESLDPFSNIWAKNRWLLGSICLVTFS